MTDKEFIKRLRSEADDTRYMLGVASTLYSRSADTIETLLDRVEKLEDEREQILLTVLGGEDAPGYAASLGLAEIEAAMAWWHEQLRTGNAAQDRVEKLERDCETCAKKEPGGNHDLDCYQCRHFYGDGYIARSGVK